MLVLEREIGQTLLIGKNGEIKITILSIKGPIVKVGIEADRDLYPVAKEEVVLQRARHTRERGKPSE